MAISGGKGGGAEMSRLVIRKAVHVLDLFSLERPEWGVSEVARELNIPKSTACELLGSLTDERLLRRTGRGRYRLGWRLFELSQTLLDTTKFRTEARKVMQELVERWGETAHLAVLEGVEAVYLEKVQPSPAVKILLSRTGARLPAHCSGVGKVLLANRDWDEVAAQLEEVGMSALTPNTITDVDALAGELTVIRERGYAYDMEEVSIGLCCVAAPIRDYSGEVVAAMSLSGPAYRFGDKKKALTAAIVDATRRVSEAIGCSVVDESLTYEEGEILARKELQSA
jgi:DNA-binding IclR family transcriptional regulator